jgi:hypothetical protein
MLGRHRGLSSRLLKYFLKKLFLQKYTLGDFLKTICQQLSVVHIMFAKNNLRYCMYNIYQHFGGRRDPVWGTKGQNSLGFCDMINQKQDKANRRVRTGTKCLSFNWINHRCKYYAFFVLLNFWTGLMIKIPRSGSILNGLGSKFNTSGFNIQRWEMTTPQPPPPPRSIFNPVQNTSLHRHLI